MKCANCNSPDVTCMCKECGNIPLCDSCFEEIHKFNIFSLHEKRRYEESAIAAATANTNSNSDDDDDDDDDSSSSSGGSTANASNSERAKFVKDYVKFLETFVVDSFTRFKPSADESLQHMCEMLSRIHEILYDFEMKMRATVNTSVLSSNDALQDAFHDISQYQQKSTAQQLSDPEVAGLTKQLTSRVHDTVKVYSLSNLNGALRALSKVCLVESPALARGELTWCTKKEEGDNDDADDNNKKECSGCALYRRGGALVFDFGGVPEEIAELVEKHPFINYKVEMVKQSGGRPVCLNVGKEVKTKKKKYEHTIVKKDLDDMEIKMAVGYLDVFGCNLWETNAVTTSGFYYNNSKGQMVCTIMNPVLDSYDDGGDREDDLRTAIETFKMYKEEDEKKEEKTKKEEVSGNDDDDDDDD